MKQGQGRQEYASGNVYEGEFVENRKEGWGTMNWHDRGEVYMGEWRNDVTNGVGTHIWLDGNNLRDTNENHHAVFLRHNRLDGELALLLTEYT